MGNLFVGWSSSEYLCYGGMAVAICSLLMGFIYFCISQVKKVHLNAQLEAEYGKKDK